MAAEMGQPMPIKLPIRTVRGAAKKKTFFLGDLSQMWVGGVADSQTRSKPLKTPPNHPENRPFRPEFHLSFSQISQNPGVGGWVNRFGRDLPKKTFFLFRPLPGTPPSWAPTTSMSSSGSGLSKA